MSVSVCDRDVSDFCRLALKRDPLRPRTSERIESATVSKTSIHRREQLCPVTPSTPASSKVVVSRRRHVSPIQPRPSLNRDDLLSLFVGAFLKATNNLLMQALASADS